MGPPVDSVNRWLINKWLSLTVVYGRYNELVFMGIIMVYKPTYNWGAPSCTYSLVNYNGPY